MGLHSNPAGGTTDVKCGSCGKTVTVYDRSFFGVGKKCPHCGFLMTPRMDGGKWKP